MDLVEQTVMNVEVVVLNVADVMVMVDENATNVVVMDL